MYQTVSSTFALGNISEVLSQYNQSYYDFTSLCFALEASDLHSRSLKPARDLCSRFQGGDRATGSLLVPLRTVPSIALKG